MKGDDRGDPALTKRICGFDSRLLLGPVIPKTFKNGSGLFLHGTHDEGGTTTHNWSARGDPGWGLLMELPGNE